MARQGQPYRGPGFSSQGPHRWMATGGQQPAAPLMRALPGGQCASHSACSLLACWRSEYFGLASLRGKPLGDPQLSLQRGLSSNPSTLEPMNQSGEPPAKLPLSLPAAGFRYCSPLTCTVKRSTPNPHSTAMAEGIGGTCTGGHLVIRALISSH